MSVFLVSDSMNRNLFYLDFKMSIQYLSLYNEAKNQV